MPGDTTEKSSLSNYKQARVQHMGIEYKVDFGAKSLIGKCDYTVRILEENVAEVVLDTKEIVVTGAKVAGADVEYKLDEPVEPFGRALRIPLSDVSAGNEIVVSVEWNTTPAAASLQWLEPAQTSGSHPYLFSQNQAIHARSMIPCQDTPMVKATYTAHVHAPQPLTALMSAQRVEPGSDAAGATPESAEGYTVYSFRQPVPIPSYLISIVVGHIDSRSVGTRTRVWAEPAVLEKAAWEFGEMEEFVAAAEALVGPYVWGTYEVLVCPKSYPYGGMEHPVVTNITPTLLAGDRSLVDVIAHECSHSWTGNLVTNATWESFWLNEGFTMMLERKICANVFGPQAYDFDAASGSFALTGSIQVFMDRGETEFTKLVPDLTGIDPDDAFSSVPYEKGFALLHALQGVVGVPAFNNFLHDYIQTYKFKTVTAEQFKAYTIAYFGEGRHSLPRVSHVGVPPVHNGKTGGVPSADEIAALAVPNTGNLAVPSAGVSEEEAAEAATNSIDVTTFPWDAWFYAPGQPPMEGAYDRSQRDAVEALADAWVDGPVEAAKAKSEAAGTSSWPASHWMAFLERLSSRSSTLASAQPPATFHPNLLEAIDSAYAFSKSGNAELRLHWYTLSLRSGIEARVPDVLDFLKAQGRMKYVRPLFRELLRTTFGRPAALALFETVKAAYHPICAKMVQVDISKETDKAAVDPRTLVQVGGPAEAQAVEPAAEASSTGATAGAAVAAAAAAEAADEDKEQPEAAAEEEDEAEAEEEGDEDEEDEEDEDSSAPRRKGFAVSVAKAQQRAQAKAKARLGKSRPMVPKQETVVVEEAEYDEEDEEEEEEDEEQAVPSTPPKASTAPAVVHTPGLSSPAASVAEAQARLAAAEARRAQMLAASPLRPVSAAERARDPTTAQKAALAARKAAAASELIKEDDLGGSGFGVDAVLGGAGTLVQETMDSVQVSTQVASTLSTVMAVAAVAAVAAGAFYVLRRRI